LAVKFTVYIMGNLTMVILISRLKNKSILDKTQKKSDKMHISDIVLED